VRRLVLGGVRTELPDETQLLRRRHQFLRDRRRYSKSHVRIENGRCARGKAAFVDEERIPTRWNGRGDRCLDARMKSVEDGDRDVGYG
jgi:hypothetical protein